MSRHRRRVKHFSRKSGPRKALIRGLISNLVEHGRITTTVEKAKELRIHVEKAITLGKKQDLASRRLLLSRIPHPNVVGIIFSDLSVRFKARPGGYTRIIKIGRRPGDTAEMAFIEFVDYDWKAHADVAPAKGEKADSKTDKKEVKAAKVKAAKEASDVKKKTSRLVAAKRKSVKNMQKKSRVASRA